MNEIAQSGGFFTRHERFRETSTVASDLDRLDFRYRHIVAANSDVLRGKRVLDIASHDGRFSFAALEGAGAAHVTGIEARESLVAKAGENMAHYGVAADRYRMICGDVFEKIREIPPGTIDTVMCLGFLYHTARQYEMFAAISALDATAVIVDSNVIPNAPRPVIVLRWEGTTSDSQIWDADRETVLSSTPSALALTYFLQEHGFEVESVEPQAPVPKSATQYVRGARVTLVGRRSPGVLRRSD